MADRMRNPTPKRCLVYCLLIDLVGSTKASLARSEDERARFNWALGQQIGPHLEQLRLHDTQVKFEGDGWLLMTANGDVVRNLAGLALIMLKRFEPEMQILLECKRAMPPLRLVLCAGNDTPILLATGAGDFAANSGRRAVRVPHKLAKSRLIIDEPTRVKLGNDFTTEPVSPIGDAVAPSDPKAAPRPLHWVKCLAPFATDDEEWRYVRDCLCTDPQPRTFVELKPALDGTGWSVLLKKLDFQFGWGSLTKGDYADTAVALEWLSDSSWAPPGIVSRITWNQVYEKASYAARNKRDFRFRPLGRVSDVLVSDGGKRLTLRLQPTMYALFAATNLNLERGPFAQAVGFWAADDSVEARRPFLASALNVIGCVVSKDNCLILPKRSQFAYEQPERYQASTGGFVERLEEGKPRKRASNAFRREIEEELGLPSKLLTVKFLGFGYNEQTGEPDLIAYARAAVLGKQMRAYYVSKRKEKIKEGKQDDELANLEDRPGHMPSYWDLGQPLDQNVLTRLCRFLRQEDEWSQPSDRVAVVAVLCRLYGKKAFDRALDAARR